MTKIEALARLEAAELTPALYRTARRILDRVHDDNGYVRIDYPQARAICDTESDETVRGHLARLTAVGLLTVHRNAAIHVYWHGWHAEGDAEETGKTARGRAEITQLRAVLPEDPATETGKTARGRAEITQLRAVLPVAEIEIEKPDYIVTTTNVVVVNNNNNNNNSLSSSSSPEAPAPMVSEPQPQQPQLPQPQPDALAINPADWARVRAAYEGNFGMFTSLLVERVKDALRQHPAEMVVMAMDKAVGAEKRRWDYVEGILRNWAVEGYGNAGTGAKGATVGIAAKGRGTGRPGDAAGVSAGGAGGRRQEAPAPEGLREWLIATGQVPAGQAAD